jgi:hypothetical protein
MSDIFIHIDFLTLYNFCYIMNEYMLQQTKDINLQYNSNIIQIYKIHAFL